MKVEINHGLLSDSPLNDKNKGLFSVVNKSTNDLIEDIINGTPTCYLVSGYRGSGKTSFVKKIQTEINKTNSNNGTETIFVYSNFSKYKDQAFLLRKLIRGLYLQIKDSEIFKKIKNEEQRQPPANQTALLLEELYDKTFYDISSQALNSNKTEKTSILNIDMIALFKLIIPLVATIFFTLNFVFSWFDLNKSIHIVGVLVSLPFTILGFLKLSWEISKKRTDQIDFVRKSMYDNEIADYHLINILSSLQKKFKVVFVLDELDKVDQKDIDALLNEMKPYFVSGAASYIIVAGQNLFYRYSESKKIDDALLSSMFSKFIHVPLFSRTELQLLFKTLLVDQQILTDVNEEKINNYVDYLIFESKRVPRKFISLVRQNLFWEEGKSFLFIDEEDGPYEIFTRINNVIDKIDDTEISAQSLEDAVKDHFKMQLYLISHVVLSTNGNQFNFDELLKQDE